MATVVDELARVREQRHEEAQRKYSEIVLRFDEPQAGDAEALDEVMEQLRIDEKQLQADIRVIEQYREYLKAEHRTGIEGGKPDAASIRRGHPQLFMAMRGKKQSV